MLKNNRIYGGDCIKLLSKVRTGAIDLVVADPPYNLGKDFGNSSDVWDDVDQWLDWSKKWIDECIRVLKPGGSIFIYGIHKYISFVQNYLYEKELNYGRLFIWHYENSWSKYRRAPASSYEPLLWFYKGDNYTFHEIREPYKSVERLKYKIIKNGKVWKPNPAGKLVGDVWKFPVLAGKSFARERVPHPTQKPLSLSDRIVNYFSNPNDLILVPFAGSGSECVSAVRNKRKFIAFELNQKYIRIAKSRLREVATNS